ncbi:hypothetical protein [Emcibacter nanhaiensis]|uniref:Uncharacterized protein n=1 Tax=Emcibacter nanhaiensis TaxID=1505037 RepID=A0A501PFZ6_9PROT|nr:hypothetical protein [Emcibacter nanhaiensis]TPD59399.1 hypothetical protein FIV46_11435 [Emcibacter nanhaiensis]
MSMKKFFFAWLAFVVLFFAAAAGLTWFTDPYLMYGQAPIAGINAIKPEAGTHSRQARLHAAHRADMDVLIVGNSRVEMGLDPDNALFKSRGDRVFNLGLPGSPIGMQYGYALDVVRDKDIKMVLIGVDFLDFVTTADSTPENWPPAPRDYDKRRKYDWDGHANPDYRLQKLRDLALPLISLSGVLDSISTLSGQKPNSSSLTADGFNPGRDMAWNTKKEGVLALFRQKTPQLVQSFTRKDWRAFYGAGHWSNELALLDRFVRELRARDIEVHIFVNPYHIHYLQVIDRAGLWMEFEKWKMALTTFEDYGDGVQVVDFSRITPFHTEPVLSAGRTPLKWFWEPAHYRRELGDLMIRRLLGDCTVAFGQTLSADSLRENLEADRRVLDAWQQANPDEVGFVNGFFAK